MRKSILIVFFILSILISGCSGNRKNSKETYKPYDSDEIKLFYPKKEMIPDEKHIEKWEKYMLGKYGIDIDLEYIPLYTPSSVKGGLYEGEIAIHNYFNDSKRTEGLVYITSFEVLNQLKDSNILIPVESFIDGLPGLSNLSIGNLDVFTDSSGNLWVVPLSDGISTSLRTYNKEYLDSAGAQIPQTVEELFEFGKLVSREDFDGNGFNDTYLFDFILNGRISSFEDIFRAFGCYGSLKDPIQFNPHMQKFENYVTNPNFVEAMTFIKLLNDENMIIERKFSEGDSRKDYNIASLYSGYISGIFEENAYSFYLTGANEKYLIREEYSCFGLAIMGNTRNPREKLADFFGLAVDNADGKVDLKYGFENDFYKDNMTYYSLLGDFNDVINRHDIGISIDLEGASRQKPIFPGGNAVLAENNKRKIEENRRVKEELSMNFGGDLSYYIPFDRIRTETEAMNANLHYDTADLFRNILYEDMPIEDAVEEYLGWTDLKYNWIEELELLNAG